MSGWLSLLIRYISGVAFTAAYIEHKYDRAAPRQIVLWAWIWPIYWVLFATSYIPHRLYHAIEREEDWAKERSRAHHMAER